MIAVAGVLLAAADRSDPDHRACAELLDTTATELRASPMVVAETAYLMGRQPKPEAEARPFRSIRRRSSHPTDTNLFKRLERPPGFRNVGSCAIPVLRGILEYLLALGRGTDRHITDRHIMRWFVILPDMIENALNSSHADGMRS